MTKITEWLAVLALTLLTLGAILTFAAPSAEAGLKRKGQNRSQEFAQKRCKQTNIEIQRGRPVKTTLWKSYCLSYSKARSTRCNVTSVPHYPDYLRVSCAPNMAWTVATNLGDVVKFQRPLPCFRESHDHPGSATGVHYNLSWLVNTISKKWAHASSNVSKCYYFDVGVAASVR